MIITNNLKLPAPFVNMAQRDYIYEPNEYRVTSLLKGVRETILERRHDAEIERDVSDMVWMLFGTAVHGVLEKHEEGGNELKEQRIKIPFGDYVLSGQLTSTMTRQRPSNYKTASVWKIIFGVRRIGAGSLNLSPCPKDRIRRSGGEIVAFLKDHSKRDAKIKADYPQFPCQV